MLPFSFSNPLLALQEPSQGDWPCSGSGNCNRDPWCRTTLSQLAFAVGQPGQPINDANIDAFIKLLRRAAAIRESAALKRAVFEAQTYLIASLRQSVERPEDAPRKVAFAERATRMENLKNASESP